MKKKWKAEGLRVVYTGKWDTTKQSVLEHMGANNVFKYAFIGHGYDNDGSEGELASLIDEDFEDVGRNYDIYPNKYTSYGIKEMQLIACNSDKGRKDWKKNISRKGFLRTVKKMLKLFNRNYEDEE